MNKIIKIALIAGVIALVGCSGDGSAALRITDPDVAEVTDNNPAKGLEKYADKDAVGNSGSSYDDDDDDDDDYYEEALKLCMQAGFSRSDCKDMLNY